MAIFTQKYKKVNATNYLIFCKRFAIESFLECFILFPIVKIFEENLWKFFEAWTDEYKIEFLDAVFNVDAFERSPFSLNFYSFLYWKSCAKRHENIHPSIRKYVLEFTNSPENPQSHSHKSKLFNCVTIQSYFHKVLKPLFHFEICSFLLYCFYTLFRF